MCRLRAGINLTDPFRLTRLRLKTFTGASRLGGLGGTLVLSEGTLQAEQGSSCTNSKRGIVDVRKQYWADRGLTVTIAGRGRPRQLVLDKPFALVGSDPSVCDVVIEDLQQPSRCFAVCLTPNGLMGVSLAYRQSPRRFKLVDDVRGVRIGGERIVFGTQPQVSFLPAEPDDGVYPTVRWQGTDHRRRHVKLRPETPILFGRALPSPLRIEDSAVSAVHGFVYRHGQQLWVVDLGSSNGTQIANQTIQCHTIEFGQMFKAGLTAVEYAATPARSATPKRRSAQTDQACAVSGSEQPVGIAESTADNSTDIADSTAASVSASTIGDADADVPVETTQVQDVRLESPTSDADVAALTERINELEQQVVTFEQAWSELHEQRADFELREAAYEQQAAELARRNAEYEAAVVTWQADRQEAESQCAAEQTLWRAEQFEQQATLDRRFAELRRLEVALADHQTQLESEQQRLAADRDALTVQQKMLMQEIETADERLLVRRIRLQRECQKWEDTLRAREEAVDQREASLDQRTGELERREQDLEQQTAAVHRQRQTVAGRDRWRLPASDRTASATSRRRPLTEEEEFELANPLLESADFTSILDGVLDKDLEIDDD